MDNGESERKAVEMKNVDVFRKILENEGMIVHSKEEYQKLQDQIKDLEQTIAKQAANSKIATSTFVPTENLKDDGFVSFPNPKVSISPRAPMGTNSKLIGTKCILSDMDKQNMSDSYERVLNVLTQQIENYLYIHMSTLIQDGFVSVKSQYRSDMAATEHTMYIKLQNFT